jgi:hypothetical protein
MTSYIPEFCYGPIYDANGYWTGQSGLVPWPEHLKPRTREPLPDVDLKALFNEPTAVPQLVEAGGVFFLSLAPNDRAGIAYTVERLINMLDAMEPDPDLEPYLAGLHQGSHTDDREGDDGYGGDADNEPSLGWTSTGHMGKEQPSMFGPDLEDDDADYEPMLGAAEMHPTSFEAVFCGVAGGRSGQLHHERGGRNSQEHWSAEATSAAFDDCEDVSEDEGAQDDREHSLGWQDEGAQDVLSGHFGDGDLEADLATTEEIDQSRRLEVSDDWKVEDSEPDLGWAESFGKGIVGPQNCLDDREQEHDGGEEELLGESPAPISGGGSVSQSDDGWRLAPGSGVAPAMVEKARRLRNGDLVREFVRPSRAVVERLMPDDAIPEIDLRAHFLAAQGWPQ